MFRAVSHWIAVLVAATSLLATGLAIVADSSASAAPVVSIAGGSQNPLVAPVAQAALTLTSTSGVVGTSLSLTSKGGSGTGAVTYVINSSGTAGCLIRYGKLDATSAGTCTLTATKAADATYLAVSSAPTKVTFAPVPLTTQAVLTLTSTSGVVGTTLALTSVGGSGTGVVTYTVTNAGSANCWITGSSLHATRGGACIVRVNKAADAKYSSASSALTKVAFTVVAVTTRLACSGEYGLVRVGRTEIVSIFGAHFYSRPTIASTQMGTNALVIHDHGNELIVRVSLRNGSSIGKYVFKVTLANRNSCSVYYLVR